MTALRIVVSSLALGGLIAAVPGAARADGPQAIATAAQHAGLASSSGDIAAVHRHLHHVLNCLVGPDGEGFDGAAGNPCAAAGGAIPQTSDNAMKMKLEKAAGEARMGIANENLDAVKKTAMELQAALK